MNYRQAYYVFGRYVFLGLIAAFGLPLLYFFLKPLTIYPALLAIKLFYHNTFLLPGTNTIYVAGNYVSIIEACVGVAAYYLLIFLNFTTPMKGIVRVKSLAFLAFTFLIINVIRIVLFTGLFVSGYSFFNFAHTVVWYIGSTALIVILWFVNVFVFKIRKVPVHSDIETLIKQINKSKKR